MERNAKITVQETITNKVLEAIDNGIAPWQMPWNVMLPVSVATGKKYRGCNIFLLAMAQNAIGEAYNDHRWLTFHQAQAHGGSVKKGERGSFAYFWTTVNAKPEEGAEPGAKPKTFRIAKSYYVFNVEQCQDLKIKPLDEIKKINDGTPIDRAEAILQNMPEKPVVGPGIDRAFYSPMMDYIGMPNKQAFTTMEHYYATLFHEIIHWTMKRVGREVENEDVLQKDSYSFEELVAEFGSAMLCGHCGINNVVENSTAYLASWGKRFRDDSKLIMRAATLAQKAVDYVLGETFEDQASTTEDTTEKTLVTA